MSHRWSARWPAIAVVLTFLAAGVLYTEAVPPWEAPDEPWHLAYAETVAAGRSPTPNDTYEAHQPPVYYTAAAAVLRILDITRIPRAPDNPWFPFAEAALWHAPGDPAVPLLRLLRTLSGLLGSLVVAVTWAIARAVAPGDRLRPALAALVIALLPQFVFIAHTINNDIAAALGGALLVYGYVVWVVRPDNLRRAVLVLAVGAALAVSTKVNVVVLILVAPLCAVLAARTVRSRAHGHSGHVVRLRAVCAPLAGIVVGLAVGSVALWLVARDTSRYMLADAVGRGTSLGASMGGVGGLAHLAVRTMSSLFGRFGWLNIDLPLVAYAVAALALVVAVAGLTLRWGNASRRERDSIAVMSAACAIAVIAVAKNMLADLQPQGRLLFPALAALAVVLATGWLWLAGQRRARAAAVSILVVGVIVNLYATSVLLPGAYEAASAGLPSIDVRVMPPNREVVAVLGGDTTAVGQSFRVSDSDVRSVAVAVAYAQGPGNVEMTLHDGLGERVFEGAFELSELEGNRWLALHVPSRYPCCSGPYEISLKLDDPGGRLGLWGTTEDVYEDGSLTGASGDLALVVSKGGNGATDDPTIAP